MTHDVEAIAEQVFTALADPTRRATRAPLAAQGPATATDLADRLPITRQSIAEHLALLTDADLVVPEPGETLYWPRAAIADTTRARRFRG